MKNKFADETTYDIYYTFAAHEKVAEDIAEEDVTTTIMEDADSRPYFDDHEQYEQFYMLKRRDNGQKLLYQQFNKGER